MNNVWKSGIWGVVVGDALGCPVEFFSRETLAHNPVTGMIGDGVPAGTWTDDSSLTLATLDSIIESKRINYSGIANNFVRWYENGDFTPYGFPIGIGSGTRDAILRFEKYHNAHDCGGRDASNNGNGSLMRIMPVVLYCIVSDLKANKAIDIIHNVSAITHAHSRSKIACGLYYFMALSIIKGTGTLRDRLQIGLDTGFAWYAANGYSNEIGHYRRLRDLTAFGCIGAENIRCSGYVVDTIEAAVWGLITTSSFRDALLKLVNLGGDTDTIAAIAGGLAGLYYGFDAIPREWRETIQLRDWISNMIDTVSKMNL